MRALFSLRLSKLFIKVGSLIFISMAALAVTEAFGLYEDCPRADGTLCSADDATGDIIMYTSRLAVVGFLVLLSGLVLYAANKVANRK
ncbi:MAG: hypothetical protein JWP13_71 [Candidatus Saccharibacteria bacterium]|nr:hypothetical protein [Candidatus Saccharibacteria bacterium]